MLVVVVDFFWQESLFDQNQPCCSHIEESVGGFSSVAEVVDNNLKVCVFYQKGFPIPIDKQGLGFQPSGQQLIRLP